MPKHTVAHEFRQELGIGSDCYKLVLELALQLIKNSNNYTYRKIRIVVDSPILWVLFQFL